MSSNFDSERGNNPCDDNQPGKSGSMAAITVIGNPLLQNKKVLLFQGGSPTYGLRVSSRDIESSAFTETIGAKYPESVGRPLAKPSQLFSMMYKDFVTVYGITGRHAKDLQVEMLSPVQSPLHMNKIRINSGAIAGCATGDGKKGWLYVLTTKDGKDIVGEWELSNNAPAMIYHDKAEFGPNTSLCALYDKVSRNRWLIYQKANKTIVVYNINGRKAFEIESSATRVMDKTPIAAAIIPDRNNIDRRMVIYFIGVEYGGHQLYSASAKLDPDSMKFEKGGLPAPVIDDSNEGKIDVLAWTGLAAYVDQVPASQGTEERARVLVYCLETEPAEEAEFNVIAHPFSNILP